MGAEVLAVWRGGRVSARRDLDPGLLSGVGVFETIAMEHGQTFALTRHLRRLRLGAERIGLPVPDDDLLRGAAAALSRSASEVPHARLRLTWTPGAGEGALLGFAAPVQPVPQVRVVISPYKRNEHSPLRGIKATSYAENVIALAEARGRGADEALLANTAGELCEGTTSNIFVDDGDRLLTPPLASGCLPGITRELCLEWGAEEGMGIVERSAPIAVMNTTSSAAVTSSLKGVVPVTAIEGRAVEIGELTRRLAEIYSVRRREDPDP